MVEAGFPGREPCGVNRRVATGHVSRNSAESENEQIIVKHVEAA